MEIEQIHEQMRMREVQFDEDILELKRQATGQARSNLQENIDLMRLQREVKDKSTKLSAVQAQYETLSSNLTHMKGSHDALLRQLEDSNNQLKQEQSRVVALQSQMKRSPPDANRLVELEEQLNAIGRENAILKEANENLVNSAFDMEREREWRQRENALKVQIAQLEATLKADLGEKGNILDRLTAEREATERQEKQHRELQREYYKLKEQHDELKEKMKFFTKESAVDFTEIEEALVLVKQRKEREEDNLDFLHKVSDEKNKDLEKTLKMLTADHAETIEELEKTRNMLIVQHQINKDYQQEVDAVNLKMEENKVEYEAKLDEYAQLLDIRAARIRKLESQMKDVAYGTRQYSIKPDDEPMGSDTEEVDESVQLERGQNLFEIHIGKMDLSKEGLKIIGDEEPSLFCTWEFFEYETQATPVVKSSSPRFEFTSQYIVKVDDFFLHHLQKESNILEVHQALGTDYRTIASCKLRFRDIFDKPHGRVHGVADVISLDRNGAVLGTLAFWVRLKVPMDQALRLYKERMKALGYISSNERGEQTTLKALDDKAHLKPPDNVNQLHVKVIRASNVHSRQADVQPCPYCVYKFFDFPDHDSPTINNSNSPEFNDLHTFPVTMAADLDSYLKSSELEVYVFDDTDPELASYLGLARVPLLALAHDKAIKGTFELHQPDGKVNGTLDLFIKWQYTYMSPPVGTQVRTQVVHTTPKAKGSSLAMMPGESLDSTIEREGVSVPPAAPLPADFHDDLHPRSAARTQSPPTAMRDSPPTVMKDSSPPNAMRKSPKGKKLKTVEFSEQVVMAETPEGSKSGSGETSPSNTAFSQPQVLSVHDSTPSTPQDTSSYSVASAHTSSADGQAARVQSATHQQDKASSKHQVATEKRQTVAAEVHQPPAVTPQPIPKLKVTKPSVGSEDGDAAKREEVLSSTASGNQEAEDEDTAFDSSITDMEEADSLTLNPESSTQGGTYFEESDAGSGSLDEEVEEEIEEEVVEEEGTGEMSGSDSEGIMMPQQPDKQSLNASMQETLGQSVVIGADNSSSPMLGEIVVVEVSHLTIREDAQLMSNPDIRRLFVAYNFLAVNPADLETPISLPKPKKAGQQLTFNFRKVFHVDTESNYERRQYLASMLLPNSPDNGGIVFNLVCEPPEEDDDADCFDIGTAFVSLVDALKAKKDITEANIPIFDIDDESTEIGTLTVSIECVAALQAVKEELPSDIA
ncbi:protein fantom-like [Watersipora subatra]|uniref:protein fantom-like n=1 Tax=Watersipora subatra TaxID=2589382 RepID=UPI00355BA7E9